MGSGLHELVIGIGPLDLSGKGLESELRLAFQGGLLDSKVVFQAPDSRETSESTVGNVLGFHELMGDSETGLMYVRNRMYDPEMGKFLQPDPMGYVDGPNLYQYGLNSPFNNSDPMGLAVYFFDGTCNNMDNPETPPTNVEKLYNAVDLTKTKREYLPGVGSPTCTGDGFDWSAKEARRAWELSKEVPPD